MQLQCISSRNLPCEEGKGGFKICKARPGRIPSATDDAEREEEEDDGWDEYQKDQGEVRNKVDFVRPEAHDF